MKKFILLLLAGFTVACSSAPTKDESTIDVPSFTAAYDAFSCDQMYSEARRITSQIQEIAGVRDEEAQMERLEFIGGVLYWPVLFLVDGRSNSKAAQNEYEQLKNRMLSLSSLVLKKHCTS
jgi:hypothetical protein